MFPRKIMLRRNWGIAACLGLFDLFDIRFLCYFLGVLASSSRMKVSFTWFLISSLADWYDVFLWKVRGSNRSFVRFAIIINGFTVRRELWPLQLYIFPYPPLIFQEKNLIWTGNRTLNLQQTITLSRFKYRNRLKLSSWSACVWTYVISWEVKNLCIIQYLIYSVFMILYAFEIFLCS